jgi:hypothetical protein
VRWRSVLEQRGSVFQAAKRARIALHPQQLADEHHRLRRLLAPIGGEEGVAGFLEQVGAAALGVHSGPAEIEGHVGPARGLRWPENQRLRVELGRLGECAQRQRPVAGLPKRVARRLGEGVSRGVGRRDVPQRAQIVVREHLRTVLAALG